MNPWFLAAYLILGAALVTVELIGVHRKRDDGDTITESWRSADKWLGDKLPWAQWFLRVFTVGLLLWTALHFGGSW
jgi:hypothetical protein